jgi:hypothetical protein
MMTTSTENNKIKNDTATLDDGNNLDKVSSKTTMMAAGDDKNKEVEDEEDSDTFDVDHAPKSIVDEGKLGSTGMRKRGGRDQRLSVTSAAYDVDGDGVLDDAERAMRDMDTDNRGYLTNDKVYNVMQQQMKLQQEVFGLKRMSLLLIGVILLLSLATLGTSFAAATLAKDTNVVDGNFVMKSSGSVVGTKNVAATFAITEDAPPEGDEDGTRRRLQNLLSGSDIVEAGRITLVKEHAMAIWEKCVAGETVFLERSCSNSESIEEIPICPCHRWKRDRIMNAGVKAFTSFQYIESNEEFNGNPESNEEFGGNIASNGQFGGNLMRSTKDDTDYNYNYIQSKDLYDNIQINCTDPINPFCSVTIPDDSSACQPSTSSSSETSFESVSRRVCKNFAVHARTTITFDGVLTTVLGGDVSVSPGTATTGTPQLEDGQIVEDSADFAASVLAAYTEAMQEPAQPMDIEIGGLTFTPGIHRSESNINFAFGTVVTLDGLNEANPVFIFQAATSTLVTAADTYFILKNGAKSENVLWALGTAATLGANSTVEGSILAGTAITFGAKSVLHGCALAQSAVTFESEGTVDVTHNKDGTAEEGSTRHLRGLN